MEWLIVLMGCWFAGMLILAVCAESYYADDELGDDPERMAWIDSLARESRKGHRTSRSRYGVSGLKK